MTATPTPGPAGAGTDPPGTDPPGTDAVRAAVEAHRAEVVAAARALHADPELMFEEHRAAAHLAGALERGGLAVDRSAFGLPTAFAARAGDRGPTVALCLEYDALPGIGHGCGHNLIAAAGLGAALGLVGLAAGAGGRLLVLGTPAEEGGGGKVLMAEAGAFDGVAAALMVHPAGVDLTEPDVLAIATLRVTYEGRAAHAAAAPHAGRNALDAAVLGYSAVAALRQHITARERVHGVFREAGDKPNIVPARAVAEWYVRAATLDRLHALTDRVRACLEGGAMAAGCTMTVEATAPEYSELRTNRALLERYGVHAADLGRPLAEPDEETRIAASTDMGNVSLLVPSIHPMVAVAPPGVALHTVEFAEWAASPAAEEAALDAATALALTTLDVWTDPGLRGRAAEEHTAAGAPPATVPHPEAREP